MNYFSFIVIVLFVNFLMIIRKWIQYSDNKKLMKHDNEKPMCLNCESWSNEKHSRFHRGYCHEHEKAKTGINICEDFKSIYEDRM